MLTGSWQAQGILGSHVDTAPVLRSASFRMSNYTSAMIIRMMSSSKSTAVEYLLSFRSRQNPYVIIVTDIPV